MTFADVASFCTFVNVETTVAAVTVTAIPTVAVADEFKPVDIGCHIDTRRQTVAIIGVVAAFIDVATSVKWFAGISVITSTDKGTEGVATGSVGPAWVSFAFVDVEAFASVAKEAIVAGAVVAAVSIRT